MSEIIFIISFILAIILLIIFLHFRNRFKLRELVKHGWGTLPKVTNLDSESSLKGAYLQAQNYATTDSYVDDLTWYDLDLFNLFQEINHTYSSIGAEYLYQQLHSYNFNDQEQATLKELSVFYQEQPQLREDLEFHFASLGKKDHNAVTHYLANHNPQRLGPLWLFIGLGCLPFIGLLLIILGVPAGLFLVVTAICFNTLFYYLKKQTVDLELSSMRYLVQGLATAEKITTLATPKQQDLQKAFIPLKSILKFGASFRVKSNSELDMFFEYLNIMLMLPFISYHFVLDKVKKHNREAIQVWKILGQLEAAAAILNYRGLLPISCQPTFTEDLIVTGEKVYHPLIAEAVSNPVVWQKNTLVTGSNASGKSTYVKSVALNCIMAQTIGVCAAETFTLKRGHVLTSMAVEDDIFEGDSYFVAEIKSIKRILKQVQKKQTCYCFVDEILKGTNTIERISASASIIKSLSPHPVLVYVATHDIELTEILKNYCHNVHFAEEVTEEQGVTFDYLLKQGPAESRNAIRLLKVLGYPADVVSLAEKEASAFDQNRSWPILD